MHRRSGFTGQSQASGSKSQDSGSQEDAVLWCGSERRKRQREIPVFCSLSSSSQSRLPLAEGVAREAPPPPPSSQQQQQQHRMTGEENAIFPSLASRGRERRVTTAAAAAGETTTTTDDNERRRRWLAVIVVARQPHPQTASCTGIAMSVPACLLASRDRAQLLLTGLGARRGRRQRE